MSFYNLFYDSNKIKKIGYEDVLQAIQHPGQFLLINTLLSTEQQVLIKGTMNFNEEEAIINGLISNGQLHKYHIIIYGKHGCDETAEKKYNQLCKLGFQNITIYYGGLFEWCLLQDIYSNKHFPTTQPVKDILQFRPPLQTVTSSHFLIMNS